VVGCALVTGAGRGLGAAIAETLAAERPVCVNWNSDADGAAAVVERIEAAGGRAVAVRADVSDCDAVESMFEQAEAELGPVLVLVNNAGTRRDLPAGFLEPEDWRRLIGVNLSGQFHTVHRALGGMVRHRFGRIVNVSSISAARPLPGQSAYAAAKAGVEAMTKTVAVEVARRGITVNAIAPGLMNTGFVAEMDEDWSAAMPPRRIAEPEEVAGLVRYLVSDEASYVNGAVLNIDGGLTAGLAIFSPRGRPAPAGIALDDD
jgi:3-oxoacyl-[acyl-carrier protein] reductase